MRSVGRIPIGVSAVEVVPEPRGREPSGALDIVPSRFLGVVAWVKRCLRWQFTIGSAAATPVRSPDALPIAAASADLTDQVVLVCRTRRVCGPMGHCRRERYCERQPDRWGGPGSGTGTGGGAGRSGY